MHENDVEEMLAQLDVVDAFTGGELRCVVCRRALNENGVGALIQTLGGIAFACVRVDCLEEFHRSVS